ncbi:hypothetical protein O6H91_18G051600 [Diphasiastrum complanatum]|uniref:Uncharacterized protein n=2 Tax=Diphasiastrum complanatum TaxID=34168 RepID=A0ACC2B142_DIPCM|nr:hypothetical protein O6H91_18G051600 [Diphasiastrum complanatum]KAJ7523486.1 hypothetical protein O6H91_18G051600 [Diphasiastrum complanatum]
MKEVGVMSPHGQTLARLGSPLNEKGRYARERINTYKYDIDAWTTLASEAQARPISEAAPLYEELLATFPTAAKYWKAYVEAHISTNSDDAAKHIFSRCLLNCLHIELWKCYIRFIRKVNDSKGQDGRDETKKAYDFMLGRIGMDIAAGPMWLEYIAFLRTAPVTAPQEDSQRMTSVRKAYQKAILAPIHHVEQLWKEYENFENSISRALAKGLLAEYQPKHFSARAVYRERKKFCERIDQNMLAVPPTGSIKEEQQLTAWKQLLAFEKANPQRLEPSALTKRVAFTYEQCLMYLYHYPDVWYDYATWHAQNGSPDSAVVVFQRALKALPDTTVLYYAYAEFEEARGSIKEAKRVYESLLRNSSTANALAYIQYMRFTRRTEGSEGARKIFFEARKAPACTYHVYVASAAMVLCIDKDPKAARTIFELGLKKYIHEPAYVLEYADFLCRLNDERNVRVLFERALSVLPPEESIEVWNCFMAFEQLYGDIPSMLKVEQRRKEALSQTGDDGVAAAESSLQQLITRYRFLDLWPCSSGDLDHLVRQQMMAQRLSGKTEQQALTSGSGNGMGGNERAIPASGTEGLAASFPGGHIVRPDLAQMIVYDPKQGLGGPIPGQVPLSGIGPVSGFSTLGPQAGMTFGPSLLGLQHQLAQGPLPPGIMSSAGLDEILNSLPPSLSSFFSRLPPVNGPYPDTEVVLSILLQADIPSVPSEGATQQAQFPQRIGNPRTSAVINSLASELSVVSRGHTVVDGATGLPSNASDAKGHGDIPPFKQSNASKRKDPEKEEDQEESLTSQSRPASRDVFRMRQLQRARVGTSGQATSTSGGSGAFSAEPSGSSE